MCICNRPEERKKLIGVDEIEAIVAQDCADPS